jgi:O-antigen/teichoic acid export membrane protein
MREGRSVAAPAPGAGMPLLLAAELAASLLGFVATVRLARGLSPEGFAGLEYAASVTAWLLVLVRGGIEVIVYREAARRPRLVGPLTDLLLGLKLACAVVGYALVLGVASLAGEGRGAVVAVAGLVLFPSALVADVTPRALRKLGWVALIQAARATLHAGLVLCLVTRPADALPAASCGAAAEGLAALLYGIGHAREYGWPRPRFRRRAWSVLAGRGAVAGLQRFARVGLYAADMLILGALAMPGLGPYAAARRIALALIGLGLVIPASLAPDVARAWAMGAGPARLSIGRGVARLVALALPASLGLMLTADRIMPALFGPGYPDSGPWLALVAARVVPTLLGSWHLSALVACRRERSALGLTLGQLAVAAVALGAAAIGVGAWGVGWAMIGVEMAGVAGGWLLLRRLDVAPPWHHFGLVPMGACVVMAAVCWSSRSWPLAAACGAGALAYGSALGLLRFGARPAWNLEGLRG